MSYDSEEVLMGEVLSQNEIIKSESMDIDYELADIVKEDVFKCNICDKEFDSKMGLLVHNAKMHVFGEYSKANKEDTSFKCNICDRKFDRKSGLTRHNTRMHKVNKIDTPKRVLRTKNRRSQRLSKLVPNLQVYKCDECNKIFDTIKILVFHKKTHELIANSKKKKDIEMKSVKKAEVITKIKENIPEVKSVKKSEVQTKIKDNIPEVKSVKKSEVQPKIKDDDSEITFIKKDEILSKIKDTERIEVAIYKCDECEMDFKKLENLKAHTQLHITEILYKCNVCNTYYNNKISYLIHKH
jgi:DNA-directed RNA polymerase subunit RPC12/RpoP